MPTVGAFQLNPGTEGHPEIGYRSRFRHETEKTEPVYCRVKLDDYEAMADLTNTIHVDFQQIYHFFLTSVQKAG